ncbi:MAG: HAD-IA family hydrolase [Alphaproteobacteria bacterium]
MKAILLGSIGVITETSELQRQSYNEAFAHHGLDWYWSIANYCELLKKPGGLKRLVTFGGNSVDINILKKIHETRQSIFNTKIAEGLRPRKGVVECINFCKQNNLKIGLITTTTPQMLQALSKSLEATIDFGSFDLITSKQDATNEKPASEIFTFALNRLNIEPSQAIAVEDTEANQSAAMQAELLCYLFAGEYAATQYNINAVNTIEHISSVF